jgi:hypothetical protein
MNESKSAAKEMAGLNRQVPIEGSMGVQDVDPVPGCDARNGVALSQSEGGPPETKRNEANGAVARETAM